MIFGMRGARLFAIAFALSFVFVWAAQADAFLPSSGDPFLPSACGSSPNVGQPAGDPFGEPFLPSGGGCSTYLGIGDVQPGAAFYVGLRAYSRATALALAKSFQVTRASDSTTLDINLTAAGVPNNSQATTFCAATTCTISLFYDQTGNGWNMPPTGGQGTVSFGCIGAAAGGPALPCMQNNQVYESAAGAVTFAEPASLWALESGFNSFNSSSNIDGCIVSSNGNDIQLYSKNFGGISNTFVMQTDPSGGNIQFGTAVAGTFKDKLGVFNGGGSTFFVNGSSTGGSLGGTQSCTSASTTQFFAAGSAGSFLEAAGWPSDVSANYAAMRANAGVTWVY